MKNIGYILVLLSIILDFGQLNAQSPEQVVAFATYQFSHITDTNHRDRVYQEEMLLSLSQQASAFSSVTLLAATGQFAANPFKTDRTGQSTTIIQADVSRYFYPQELTLFHQEQRFYVTENIVNNYLYEMDYPHIDWSVDTATRLIRGLQSQRAVTQYKGREWTVWFCTDIPFSAGPWELCGLPGLIVSASDVRGEVTFELTAFEQASSVDPSAIPADKLTISVPQSTSGSPLIETDKATVDRLWQAMERNPDQFIRTQIRAAGGIIHHLIRMESLAKRPVINNPIALSVP